MPVGRGEPATPERRLLVIGAGLIGTSVALAAQRAGWTSDIVDESADRQRAARELLDQDSGRPAEELGEAAGRAARAGRFRGSRGTDPEVFSAPATPQAAHPDPALVCVAVSPADTASAVVGALERYVACTVIDVCSVKAQPQSQVESRTTDRSRFVGTHPLAGSEGSGPLAGRPDLFRGRSWVVCPGPETEPSRLELVEQLIADCLAHPVRLAPAEHDRLLAVTSHLPQVLASALAALVDSSFGGPIDGGVHDRRTDDGGSDDSGQFDRAAGDRRTGDGGPGDGGPGDSGQGTSDPSRPVVMAAAVLAGPALLDMTRIASSPGEMWAQIAAANAGPLRAAVADLVVRLTAVRDQLSDPASARSAVGTLVDEGRAARGRMGLKHAGTYDGRRGRQATTGWTWVDSAVDDTPGALARIFAEAARIGVNVEDVQVDHAPYASAGVVSVALRDPDDAAALRKALHRHNGTTT